MTIGQRIKNRRIELHMSQEELSRKMGYSTRNAIYQFEQKDNMKLSLVEKFANALDVSPAYLMGWEDENVDSATYDRQAESYAVNEKKDELYRVYEGLSPEKQAAFEAYLRYLRSES